MLSFITSFTKDIGPIALSHKSVFRYHLSPPNQQSIIMKILPYNMNTMLTNTNKKVRNCLMAPHKQLGWVKFLRYFMGQKLALYKLSCARTRLLTSLLGTCQYELGSEVTQRGDKVDSRLWGYWIHSWLRIGLLMSLSSSGLSCVLRIDHCFLIDVTRNERSSNSRMKIDRQYMIFYNHSNCCNLLSNDHCSLE